ncbi:MAG: acyltransferase family protein [Prevotella sp.]
MGKELQVQPMAVRKVTHANTLRMSSVDVIKCFAAISVIAIHVGPNILSFVIRAAVPLFFLISGYYYPQLVESGKFWRHIKKLVVMVLLSSLFYGVIMFLRSCHHGDVSEWMHNTFNLGNIYKCFIDGNDLFGFHLWFFYSLIYDLMLLWLADKYGFTKCLKVLTPILLFVFLLSNFFSFGLSWKRNFLFFGLPFVMFGRCIAEGNDRYLSIVGKPKFFPYIAIGSLLMTWVEIYVLYLLTNTWQRETYVFSVPFILSVFYWALRNVDYGKGSVFALIGSRYSAYIYIFHVAVIILVDFFIHRDSLINLALNKMLVYSFSIIVPVIFVWLRNKLHSLHD